MRIRRAEVGDARRVAVVHVDSWRAAYAGLVADDVIAELSVDGQEAAWRARLGEQDDRAWTLVAEDEERLLGFCSLAAGSTGPGGAGDEVGSGGSGDEDGARRGRDRGGLRRSGVVAGGCRDGPGHGRSDRAGGRRLRGGEGVDPGGEHGGRGVLPAARVRAGRGGAGPRAQRRERAAAAPAGRWIWCQPITTSGPPMERSLSLRRHATRSASASTLGRTASRGALRRLCPPRSTGDGTPSLGCRAPCVW